MHLPSLIEKKRDGGELAPAEIDQIIHWFTTGEVPDYQLSALAMAIFFRGMTPSETASLTRAMMRSGHVLQHPGGSPPKVDKHSTGGIGDKVSLVLAPLLACDHLWVPMISGRGLGVTGGTLDKLESIPGFNVFLDRETTSRQLEKIGVVMIGQTDEICPADKKFYALRDVTGTVQSRPLIIASIMSKKLAESLDRLVLDVKFGTGAFMKNRGEAELLAEGLRDVGQSMGVQVSHLLTAMDEPLGETVGNALETREAIDALHGQGPPDLLRLVLDLAEKVANAPRATLARWLEDGTAWNKFVALVEAQGGDASALDQLESIHRAPVEFELLAETEGTLEAVDALGIGTACVRLGAGRQKTSDSIDPAVGCSRIKKVGTRLVRGEPVLRVHARDQATLDANLPLLREAIQIG